jgi:hypothetical protein
MPPSSLLPGSSSHSASLVDLLDRVLDKGLVVAGDIKISLAEVHLPRENEELKKRIRLLERKIASRAGPRRAGRGRRRNATPG